MKPWTDAEALRCRLQKEWDKGRLLAAILTEETLFPLRLPVKQPTSRELGQRFGEVRQWLDDLVAAADGARGFALEWQEVNHRQLGRNRLPTAALFVDQKTALRFIGRQREADRFRNLCRTVLAAFPELSAWLARRPLLALTHAEEWPRLLAVLAWLVAHPRPGIYLRQLEIPGVDTKFMEQHRPLLAELLDVLLPANAIDPAAKGVAGFEQRYGFAAKPVRIRFRLLDAALTINGLTDLEIPAEAFARLNPPVRRVFITENEINGLAFPPQAGAMVIFGLGYGLDRLAAACWLHDKEIFYWGDIDTHGFAMLDQLRHPFPHARSLLMDRQTLLAHQPLWGKEQTPTSRELPRLDAAEAALYEDLRHDRLAPGLRLEQERISFTALKTALTGVDRDGKKG
ncbi:MAG: DUF3322 domain-containing protein [Desulfobulbaceae bacterium]|nr:DUF3322 domain-containing protein [Desulfobulbaceae bacterium]